MANVNNSLSVPVADVARFSPRRHTVEITLHSDEAEILARVYQGLVDAGTTCSPDGAREVRTMDDVLPFLLKSLKP